MFVTEVIKNLQPKYQLEHMYYSYCVHLLTFIISISWDCGITIVSVMSLLIHTLPVSSNKSSWVKPIACIKYYFGISVTLKVKFISSFKAKILLYNKTLRLKTALHTNAYMYHVATHAHMHPRTHTFTTVLKLPSQHEYCINQIIWGGNLRGSPLKLNI